MGARGGGTSLADMAISNKYFRVLATSIHKGKPANPDLPAAVTRHRRIEKRTMTGGIGG
jgi:hypothetical protein